MKASRVGFSQAQRFLTGAVIPRAHGPTPAPAPNRVFLAVGSLARVGALFSREFRALGGKIAFLCTGAKYSGIFDPIEVLGALLGVCWGGLQRLSGAWYCCWEHSKLICGGGGRGDRPHGSLSTYCRILLLLAPSCALAAPSRGGSTSFVVMWWVLSLRGWQAGS